MHTVLSGDLHAGDTHLSIHKIVERCPQMFQGCSILLVTLDSSRELDVPIGKLLGRERARLSVESVGEGVLFPPKAAQWLIAAKGVLVHFDELYVLPPDWSMKDVEPIPSFSVDRCAFRDGVPNEFQAFFKKIGALRYFADGTGYATNYCVSDGLDAGDLERAESAGANTETEAGP